MILLFAAADILKDLKISVSSQKGREKLWHLTSIYNIFPSLNFSEKSPLAVTPLYSSGGLFHVAAVGFSFSTILHVLSSLLYRIIVVTQFGYSFSTNVFIRCNLIGCRMKVKLTKYESIKLPCTCKSNFFTNLYLNFLTTLALIHLI